MIRRSSPSSLVAEARIAPANGGASPSRVVDSAAEVHAYGVDFWFAYAANMLLTTATALLFRYGDFVTSIGGTEFNLGWIVGVGMIGSLLMRAAQGVGIDVYGARQIWLLSNAGFTLSCLGHLAVGQVDGVAVYALRVLYQTSVAGFFGASITFVARRAPANRMAEVVGTLGTSGFMGMVLGSWLVDRIFEFSAAAQRVDFMFATAAGLSAVSFVFGLLATRNYVRPPRRRQPPVLWLLRRYHPGMILLVSVAMGFGLSLPSTFVRPFTAYMNISGIAVFFTVYAGTGFVTRMSIRRFPERFGFAVMIHAGMAAMVASMLLFLVVSRPWQMALPATMLGVAHALMFPAVIAGGNTTMPLRYRGLGTTLLLAMFDLGAMCGAPTVGVLLRVAEALGWPKYTVTFVVVAALMAAIAVAYVISELRQRPQRRKPENRPTQLSMNMPDAADDVLPQRGRLGASQNFGSGRPTGT
ncbi:MAG: MFS transporter [Pirellulales bacterium]|nr:MFS transporter [Pirellulales bacterium]